MPLTGGIATGTVVTGIVKVGGAIYNLFKGKAEKRKATNQSVCAFWDPILGANNYPQKFQSWLWGLYRSPKNASFLIGYYKTAEMLLNRFSKEQILNDNTVPQEIKNLVNTMEILPGGEFFYKNGLKGTRNANRGASLTNDIIEGNSKIWQELADVLGDKMPSMDWWAKYLGWGNALPESNMNNSGIAGKGVNNNESLNTKNIVPLLAGAFLLIKIL